MTEPRILTPLDPESVGPIWESTVSGTTVSGSTSPEPAFLDPAFPDSASDGSGLSDPGPGEPLIAVRDLRRTYPQPRTAVFGRPGGAVALRGVSFDVRRGQRLGIVGESGSGKSTLVRLLAALDRPTAGSISFAGRPLFGRKRWPPGKGSVTVLPERRLRFLRTELQVVFQDPMGSLDPRMRVRDIIGEPLVAARHPDRRRRLRELLDAVGLPSDAGDRYPHQFSGGQRQRISLARALAPAPSVLVADEPVSALDVSVRAQILNLIADLVDEFALTLVFVSHDLSVVRHVCDTVAVMRQGEIVESGTVDKVYGAPTHPYTRALISAAPTLRTALARGVDTEDDGGFDYFAGGSGGT